jgi:PPOX class probable F420-dependent enzyme
MIARMMISSAIEAFISDQRVARLATVDRRGRPHIVPVCFVYGDGLVHSVLDAKPKRVPVESLQRVRNLLTNPHVQVLIDRYNEDWAHLAYVQLRGLASLLREGPEQVAAIARLRAKYRQYESMDIDASPVIRIEVRSVVTWGDLAG